MALQYICSLSQEIQQQFVSTFYEHALYEAYLFYSHVKTYAQNLGVPLNKEHKILDFGCIISK